MRVACGLALLGALACSVPRFDAEGLRCDDDNPCGEGYLCTQGQCHSCTGAACNPGPVDLCERVVCDAPPVQRCQDASTLRTFATGACDSESGACRYPSTDLPCAFGCQGTVCRGDPCAGVSCTTPPAPLCLDPKTVRSYAQSGTCTAAQSQCVYEPTDAPCPSGCSEGRCKKEDLCAGKVCEMSPPAACVPGAVRTFTKPGTCDPGTGQCTYAQTDVPCALPCQNGVCMTPAAFSQVGPRLRSRIAAVDQAPGSAGAHVLVVGPGGYAAKWNGGTWSVLSTGTTQDLRAVWLSSATSGYVAGNGGTLLRYDGAALTPVNVGGLNPNANYVSVHGAQSYVLAAAEGGQILRFDGATWSAPTFVAAGLKLTGAYVSPTGEGRVVGASENPPRPTVGYASGPATQFLGVPDAPLPGGAGFLSVGPSDKGNPTAGLGLVGTVRLHHGVDGFSPGYTALKGGGVVGIAPGGTATRLYALTAAGPGAPGALFDLSSAGPRQLLTLSGSQQALSRNESGGVVVADSKLSSASIYRRSVVTDEVLEVAEHWVAASAHPSGSGVVLLSADGAVALRPDVGPGRFTWVGANATFTDVAAGSAFSLVVGAGGSLYRWAGGNAPTQVTSGTLQGLRSLCRVSDAELYVVGDSGTALKTDGTTVTGMTTGTARNLRAVACLGPGSALAVGEGGTVLRLSGTTWAPLMPAFPDPGAALNGLSVRTGGGTLDVTAGNRLWRLSGNQWTQSPPAPSPVSAPLLRDLGDTYALGGKDVLRFDGVGWSKVFTAPYLLAGSVRAGGRLLFVGSEGVLVEGK